MSPHIPPVNTLPHGSQEESVLGKRPDLELSVEPSILRRCERECAIHISTKANRPPVQSNLEVMTIITHRKFHLRAADVVNWRLIELINK